jgi:integrase
LVDSGGEDEDASTASRAAGAARRGQPSRFERDHWKGEIPFPLCPLSHTLMSENTINAALRRLGFRQDEMTAHGFRSAASSILNESGLWNPDAIERQLAHVDNDRVRRAYARADFWDERVRMMSWWADKCDELRRGGVLVSLRA